jgi:tetratricopeptide (TPR) repeat protein
VPGLLLIILSVLTLQRNYVWHDKITLWTDVINKSPHKFRGYYNLGNAYRDKNMFDDAIKYYERAIDLNPLYHRSYDGLSYIYSQNRMYDIAKEYSIKSLNINALNSDALNRLGYIYIQTGNPETAIEYFKKAYNIKPRDIIIIKNLVLANAIFKNYTDSISILQKYLEANPTSADAHFLLATALYEDKNYSRAKYHCNLAVRYGYAVPAALIEALETISAK